MALKVLSAEYESELNDIKRKSYYLQICAAELRGRLEINGVLYSYSVIFKPGFRSDGASVPWGFRWFLPKWADNDPLYNAFAKAHDLFYALAGQITSGEKLSREDGDDFLRGGWRETETLKNERFARFRTGTADFLIKIFAGGKKHWGNDSLDCTKYATFSITKISG